MKIQKTCPKCGYDDTVMTFVPIGTKYYNNGDAFKLFKKFLGQEKKDAYTTKSAKIVQECVKVHCRTCQYTWVTNTVEPTNAFGLSNEDINKAHDQLQKDISEQIKSESNQFDPFMPLYRELFSGEMFPSGSYGGWDK